MAFENLYLVVHSRHHDYATADRQCVNGQRALVKKRATRRRCVSRFQAQEVLDGA
jgi:hypothetical protein